MSSIKHKKSRKENKQEQDHMLNRLLVGSSSDDSLKIDENRASSWHWRTHVLLSDLKIWFRDTVKFTGQDHRCRHHVSSVSWETASRPHKQYSTKRSVGAQAARVP